MATNIKNSIINWTKVSNLLADNDGSVRENKFPEKYRKKVEFIKRWEEYLMKELEYIKNKE